MTPRNSYFSHSVRIVGGVVLAAAIQSQSLLGQMPTHPIITEMFNNPVGHDGPTARTPSNPHQEFFEIYVPAAADLDPSLNKDFLRLTFYEIEGDSANAQRGRVNQRFDLPSIDADLSNGVSPGAKPRPASGIIILGWVDYNTLDPPTALAGTSSSRIALINGGVTTSPPGTMFVAMNGNQFGGTTNFATPVSESFIDVPNENTTGVVRNGSNVYLLLNRDDPGYAILQDRQHPELGPSDAALPSGTVIGLSALLDGFAGNDDDNFDVSAQPYATPTGLAIDLEDVLPAGGVFSNWIAQIPENLGGGYARRFVDVAKTTEDTVTGNEDPAFDAVNHYRVVFRSGPFFATPGEVVFLGSPPELGVSEASRLQFDVLAGTTGNPGLLCANVGGDFPIDVGAAPGGSTNPAVVTFAPGASDNGVPGQTFAFPAVSASVPLNAPNGAVVTAPVTFTAVNSQAGDPPVQNAVGVSSIQATVLRPTRGTDPLGLPYQATVFAALEGHGADAAVANEFLVSDVGQFVLSALGHEVLVSLGNGDLLTSPDTDLESFDTIGPLRLSFPNAEADFINAAGAPGTHDLVTTVTTSPKFIASPLAYAGSVNASHTGVRAYPIILPETATSGGAFSPGDVVYFVEPIGAEFNQRDGLGPAVTERTFELALVQTNVTSTGIEQGVSDDFGLIVEVGRTRAGASVVPGEFIFLSYTGGLGGEDIDGVDIPGTHATVTILLDLDNLDTILGCETITRMFVLDASASGTVNVIEALSLNPLCAQDASCPFFGDGDRNGIVDLRDFVLLVACTAGPDAPPAADNCSMFDTDQDGDVDLADYAAFQRLFAGS